MKHSETTCDQRNSVTLAYTNNEVNEYTSIKDAPGGGGAVTVYYDAAGNLSKDEKGFEYGYDYENRLTQVTYTATGSTQVAAFEYDALGRLISSQLRYDADANAVSQTLKYYYDGPNEIAEYDPANNLSRRYVHGTRQVDERAILLEGEYLTLDTYYYLLEELDTVAGLVGKNASLVEAYEHDAYGKVKVWGYRPVDFDRDGDVDSQDAGQVYPGDWLNSPPNNAMHDASSDGIVDTVDWSYVSYYSAGSGAPPITLYTSSVGNPFIFTGRRMHWMEADFTGDPADNKEIQYNRARHYDLANGRWLQRDPLNYVDGMSLYEYVRSAPARGIDPYGTATISAKSSIFIDASCPRRFRFRDGTSEDLAYLVRSAVNSQCKSLVGSIQGLMRGKKDCTSGCVKDSLRTKLAYVQAGRPDLEEIELRMRALGTEFCDPDNPHRVQCRFNNSRDKASRTCAVGGGGPATTAMVTIQSLLDSPREPNGRPINMCIENIQFPGTITNNMMHEMLRQLSDLGDDDETQVNNEGWDNLIGKGSSLGTCLDKCRKQ